MPNSSKYFECEVCGKTLLSKYSLNMHVNKHSTKEKAVARKNRLKSWVHLQNKHILPHSIFYLSQIFSLFQFRERAAAKNSARGMLW